jgi:hypothetical protein
MTVTQRYFKIVSNNPYMTHKACALWIVKGKGHPATGRGGPKGSG